MMTGQKMYVVGKDGILSEVLIEKVTRSLITLDNGVVIRNQPIWDYEENYYHYDSKDDQYTALESYKNAMKFVNVRKFKGFDINGYRNIKYPTKPSTPRMSSTSPSKDEIIRYQVAMEEFESEMKIFTEETQLANKLMREWMDTYTAYLSHRDGLDGYSEEIRSAVYSMAYDAGHSSGYYEVANYHSTFAEFAIKVIELSKK